MPPDDFWTELCGSLTDFYENILKKASAGGRRVAMPLSRKFVTQRILFFLEPAALTPTWMRSMDWRPPVAHTLVYTPERGRAQD